MMLIKQEIFALPVKLKQVYTLGNIPLYGSETLNTKLVEAIQDSKRGKPFAKKINSLIEEKKIIPCFMDQGMLKYFFRRITNNTSGGLLRVLRIVVTGGIKLSHPLDHVLAFYDFNTDKIVILISNHIEEKFSNSASNESITITLLHEMMHMFAHQRPTQFLQIFVDELNSFYLSYFQQIFELKKENIPEQNKIVEQIYTYLFKMCEMKSSINFKGIEQKLKLLQPYSNLSKEEFKSISDDYIFLVHLLSKNDLNTFIEQAKTKYRHMVVPFYKAYKNSFKKYPIKGVGQELYYPSEVICGVADVKTTAKIKSALQNLK